MNDLERVLEWSRKIERCESKGHYPFEQKIVVPYHPDSSRVLMICTNCRFIYERPPTKEERESYARVMGLEITV